MGTITARRRLDGSTGYTAQIRIKRAGRVIHSETGTFDRRALAMEWMRRREVALDQQRARGEPLGKRATLGELIAWYEREVGPTAQWQRTKAADLARLRGYPIARMQAQTLTAEDFIRHIQSRRESGAGPATAANDLTWIMQVMRSARPSLRMSLDLQALEDARQELRARRMIGKSRKRNRRPTDDEIAALMRYFAGRDRRAHIPIGDIVQFALISARREAEITRLLWADLDRGRGVALLRDVKHPTRKIGNHRTFRLLENGWQIIERQPRNDARVFPCDSKSVGAAFHRACKFLGIEDLRFHDLRHEATSRLFERGYTIQQVAQFTLHESWSTLQRYTHLRPEHVPEKYHE